MTDRTMEFSRWSQLDDLTSLRGLLVWKRQELKFGGRAKSFSLKPLNEMQVDQDDFQVGSVCCWVSMQDRSNS